MKHIEFINAGAGSGKTRTLTTLLCEYLDGTKENYKPSQVILTTFTELAAAEFREKARGALLENGMFGQAAQLETASIGTVHSVAFYFVKKFWYLLGRGAIQNVMAESDRQFYMNQSLADLATEEDVQFFGELHGEFNFSKYTGRGSPDNPDFWKDDLEAIIEKMVTYEIDDLDRSIKNSKDLIDEIFTRDVDVNEDDIREVFTRYTEICGNKGKRTAAENGLRSQNLGYSSLLELYSISPIDKERQQIPELDNILLNIGEALRSKKYGKLLKEYIGRIFKLAKDWKDEFDAYKAKNRLIDYNDMEKLFLELLEKKAVQQEIKNRFKLVFVDEFQDSSPIQVKIFDKLSDLVEKSIWVGDPKQAIYGFRGSDSLLINAITRMFDREGNNGSLVKGESLNTSYRSRKDLVKLSNRVFTRAFDNIPKEDVALQVHRDDTLEFGENAPHPVIHWHTESTRQRDKARDLAQRIVELLQSETQVFDRDENSLRRIQPEDIAILCRNNIAVNSIAKKLQDYDIKTTGQKADETFVETAEVKLFLAILNFLQNPFNRLAKAEILHLTDPETHSVENIISSRMRYLHASRDNSEENHTEGKTPDNSEWKDNHPLIQKISSLSRELKALPVPDLVERIMTELDLKSIVASWGNHEKRQNNLDALVNHALDYDRQCLQMGLGASLNNFIVYLNSLESREQKPEKVKGSVNVLTYHKAKGLEWNAVILESLEKDELTEDDIMKKSFFGVNDMVTEMPSAENLFPERYIQLLPWFMGAKKTVPEDIKQLIRGKDAYKIIADKTREEVKRLLYVGVTRARDYLVSVSYGNNPLKWIENIGGREIKPANCTGGTIDVWDSGIDAEWEIITGDPEFGGIGNTEQPKRLVRPSGEKNFEARYVSPSKTNEEATFEVEVLKNFGKRISTKADKETDDAEIGNCLHHIYYSYSRQDENPRERAESILQNLNMRSVFPSPQDIVDSINNLYQFLESKYGAAINIYKELPLQHFTENEQVIRGSIDLVWETENGAVVLDYKSYQGGVKNITNQDDKHDAGIHGPQLLTYQRMLEAAGKKVLATCIYYAVMGVVVEVKLQ